MYRDTTPASQEMGPSRISTEANNPCIPKESQGDGAGPATSLDLNPVEPPKKGKVPNLLMSLRQRGFQFCSSSGKPAAEVRHVSTSKRHGGTHVSENIPVVLLRPGGTRDSAIHGDLRTNRHSSGPERKGAEANRSSDLHVVELTGDLSRGPLQRRDAGLVQPVDHVAVAP